MGVEDDVVEYLVVKQQLLLSYCMNALFYLYMKSEGHSVAQHPVMRQLLELRYIMEKMRSLDGKLKYQVDRLMKLSTLDPEEIKSSVLRPNPAALMAKDGDDEDEDDDDMDEDMDDDDGGNQDEFEEGADTRGMRRQDRDAKGGLYKAPKMNAMPYKVPTSSIFSSNHFPTFFIFSFLSLFFYIFF